MSFEVLILGMVSALRPATSQAALFALLKAPAAGRSLLAFCFAGIVVSVGLGMLVVVGFNGAGVSRGESTGAALFDLIAGVAALGFAAGVQRGRVIRPREAAPGPRRGAGITERLRHPSVWTAGAAGIATHIPGLIYLVALNAIASGEPSPAAALAQIALYNALWFALPLAALLLAIRSPRRARLYLDKLTAWARRHQERILIVIFGGLGVYLTVKGIVALT
jgi:hypothetical protein